MYKEALEKQLEILADIQSKVIQNGERAGDYTAGGALLTIAAEIRMTAETLANCKNNPSRKEFL